MGCACKVVSACDIALLMALGCIQSQHCHTDHCPTGVATQDPIRQKALVVPSKIERVFNFHRHTLESLKELVQAAGLQHPNEITANHIVRRVGGGRVKLLMHHLEFVAPGALLRAVAGEADWPFNVYRLYWPMASARSFAPQAGVDIPGYVSAPEAHELQPTV